ncbi:CASP-like protein 4D1 [Andrographis paniculata]|uniref:CASP-like protein 4D1 n=1 Tax=Andrographis paniculata TaxID=175694 RepID=UPI0021E795D1|nr:CASP-like protein 4D1 [Andrographis paniculata]
MSTTLPPQHDREDQSQTWNQVQDQSEAQISQKPSQIISVISLVMKLVTVACLIVSTSLFASNSTTIRGYYTEASVHFNDIYSYRYALSTAVIGLAYTLLQIPFSIHQVMTSGKQLPNHAKLLVFEFVGDKVVMGLLATGVGAAFGITVDLKKILNSSVDDLEQNLDITTLSLARVKLNDFFDRVYFPAVLLLVAFLACGASSIVSSLALSNKTRIQTQTNIHTT